MYLILLFFTSGRRVRYSLKITIEHINQHMTNNNANTFHMTLPSLQLFPGFLLLISVYSCVKFEHCWINNVPISNLIISDRQIDKKFPSPTSIVHMVVNDSAWIFYCNKLKFYPFIYHHHWKDFSLIRYHFFLQSAK